MELVFIRHFPTKGNRKRRYIGVTDEPLDEGYMPEKGKEYPKADFIVTSPMKRCKETAEVIYPDMDFWVCESFRECNFGQFEGKSYEELKDEPEYQKWLGSEGKDPFPGGESHEDFVRRCILGMEETMRYLIRIKCKRAAFVVHGGTIMAIFSAFAGGKFYDWQLKNGEGVQACVNEEEWARGKKYFTGAKII